jgi:hypothetical protein
MAHTLNVYGCSAIIFETFVISLGWCTMCKRFDHVWMGIDKCPCNSKKAYPNLPNKRIFEEMEMLDLLNYLSLKLTNSSCSILCCRDVLLWQ